MGGTGISARLLGRLGGRVGNEASGKEEEGSVEYIEVRFDRQLAVLPQWTTTKHGTGTRQATVSTG